ncbi:MAG: amino acid adenylation domain-containing protein, partial [bacterium]|nr:amino acid adenylation domain-containing protein [bacterium]
RTQINDVLLTALVRAVARWTGQRSLLLELEGHGREELFAGLDVSRTVGWFTTTCPLLLTLADGEAAALKGIKEQLRAVPRRGIGYGLVRYLGNDPETLAELRSRPEPEISFNYLGQLDSLLSESSLFALAEEEAGPIRSLRGLRPRVLEINCGISGGELRMRWTYSRHLHRRATIERLAGDFLNQLEGLIAHCLAPGAGGTTPSDFPLAGLDQKTLDRITGELAHRDLEDVYPLSPMQEGMLFHTLAAPASEIYCEQLDWALRGPLDLRAFRSAWERVVERYGVLRSSFVWEDLKRPLQIVHRRVALPFSEHDWRDLGPGEQQDRLAATLAAERERGFQLAQAPLMRLTVVRLGDESYRVVWTSHHLLLDGWSMPLLLEEVFAFYQGYCSGREIERPLPRPYRDYIAWLAGRDPAPAAEYWRRRLAGFTQPTPLPLAAGEIEAGDGRQEERELRLPAASTARLCALARGRQLTLNTLVQGAWALVLARTTGEDDVAFGTVDSGRPESLPGADGIIGLMINTLPVRVRIRPDEPLRPWLERLQEEIAESRRFGTTPLVEIRSFSEVPSELPLFDTILAFQNYPIRPELRRRHPQIDDLRGFSRTNYPLTLVAAPGDELLLRLTYETARVSATGAGRLLRHLRVLLTGMVGASTLASLTLLSAAERHQLLVEWNDIPSRQPADGRSLPELFAAQARRAPDAVAVILVHSDRTLTYAELNRRANQLAHHLRRLGVGPEVRVGLCLERSPEMIVALLGILKAGGAYVPLEPSYPAERLAQILDDAGVAVLVTTSEVLARLPVHRAAAVCLDLEAAIADGPESSPEVTVRSQNTAYVIYTSGSTGRPKGVAVTHGNVVRLFAATRDWFRFGPGDVWTLFHSIAFDFSVWEVWGALVHGGRLVVVPYLVSRSPEAFCELLADAGVTVLNQTPSAFRMLIEAEARIRPKLRLRWVIFGGEALELTSLIPWFARHGDRRPRLVNMYGITETTVHVTYRPISETEARRVRGSLIGRQIPDLRLYVLDPRRRPVPVAVPGELCVGGAGLARGYLGRPGLTAERFVPSPFDEVPGARLYRTGDRVRVRATGELEYLGRIDHQLKIRGFRIEPGEIEAVLSEHPAVRHCLVMAREDEPGKKRLVAYWIGDEEAGAAELRERLHAKLPEYMVPATFVRLVAFPLTPHGKVDRRALPPPEGAEPKEGGIGPRNTAEELLAAIWCAVLGIERVGMDDSFFAAGGDSILAIRLLARMRQSGLDLTLEQLFQYPTIAELARLASRGDGEAVATATHPFSLISAADRRELPPEVEDAYPLTRMQAGMLFHSELSPETSIYHDIF